ncbi:hypothetical protein [Streptomyces sp. NPDC056670]|uniref:hypothetical protein n=1 Tax=Streptomyces sp. NPDC056670 TaxID=3345904 RepID=UPI00369F1966
MLKTYTYPGGNEVSHHEGHGLIVFRAAPFKGGEDPFEELWKTPGARSGIDPLPRYRYPFREHMADRVLTLAEEVFGKVVSARTIEGGTGLSNAATVWDPMAYVNVAR